MALPFVIIVATGSPDINTQIALQFASQYPIALLYDDPDAQGSLDQTAKAVQEKGSEIVLFKISYSANENLSDSMAAVTNHFGKRCAAAIFQLHNEPNPRPFLERTGTGIRKESVLSISAAYTFAQQTIPLLLNHADGSGNPPTLMFAGTSGRSCSDEINDNALVALHSSLGREFGSKGVHVCHIKYKKGVELSSSDQNPQFALGAAPRGVTANGVSEMDIARCVQEISMAFRIDTHDLGLSWYPP